MRYVTNYAVLRYQFHPILLKAMVVYQLKNKFIF